MAHALCLSHCPCISHTRFCSPTHSPTYQLFTHPLIPFLTLLLHLSLSLSLMCTRELACVSLSPSFSRCLFCILSQSFSLSRSFSFTHTLAHTQSHALSHALTHTRTQGPDLYLHLSRTLTHISVSFFLSLFLLHTKMDTHTHLHSHTLLLVHSPTHSFIAVVFVRCAVFSARTHARSLLSVSSPLPPFLILCLSESISFSLFLSSRSLACSPSFSHSFASSRFQLLVAMI